MLTDSFERKFNYLRLSVTDVCNFKCTYCLPQGYVKPAFPRDEELSLQEVRNLLIGFSLAGFTKVRFTGGEPTTRSDLISMIETAQSLKTFQKIGLSTNGWNLKKQASLFRLAGVTHLNVSIDTLIPERFYQMTGRNQLREILEGIDESLRLKFAAVKINSVLHRDHSLEEFPLFLRWIKDRPVSVRFIELMKTGDHAQYHSSHFLSAGTLRHRLLSEGWKLIPRAQDAGPAVEFVHPDYQGSIGIIAPYSTDFCSTCNRLRITAQGKLRLCLFGDQDYSLRSYFQSESLAHEIPQQLKMLLTQKAASHLLHEGTVGNVTNFSMMGG